MYLPIIGKSTQLAKIKNTIPASNVNPIAWPNPLPKPATKFIRNNRL